jgi:iron complex outermembrane receptor protein
VDILAAAGIYANVVWSYKDEMPITSDNLFRTDSYNILNAKVGIRRSILKHFDLMLISDATTFRVLSIH